MGGLLFVSQSILDSWAGQGKIDFSGNVMAILSGDGQGRSYRLEPAVRFLKVVGGEADPHQLLHKVKGEVQLREMGAEVMDGAVILGEVGYEVEQGFLAEASALQHAAASPADPARAASRQPAPAPPPPPHEGAAAGAAATPAVPGPATPSPEELEQRRKEAEELARFLLENLS
jgi:hypothetical protein